MTVTVPTQPILELTRALGNNKDLVFRAKDKHTKAPYDFTGHTALCEFKDSSGAIKLDMSPNVVLATGKITIQFSAISSATLAAALPIGKYSADFSLKTTGGWDPWVTIRWTTGKGTPA